MSFRLQPLPPARLNRCQLFGPGSRTALFEKMAKSAADVINIDLEDSVTGCDRFIVGLDSVLGRSQEQAGRDRIEIRGGGFL